MPPPVVIPLPPPPPPIPISAFNTASGTTTPGAAYTSLTFALVGGGGAGVGGGGGTGGVIVYGTVPINGADPITWNLGLGSTGTIAATPSTLTYTGPGGTTLVTANGGNDSPGDSVNAAGASSQSVAPGLNYIMLGGGGGAYASIIFGEAFIGEGTSGTSLGPHSEDAAAGTVTGTNTYTVTSGNGAGQSLLPAELLALLPVNPPIGGSGISLQRFIPPNVSVAGGGGAGLGDGGNGGYSLNAAPQQASTPGVYGGGGAGSVATGVSVNGGDGAFVYVIS